MCTNIATKVEIAGSAKTRAGWFQVDQACVGFDHASQVWAEHALRVDLFDSRVSNGEHVALEIDLASGKRLLAELAEVIAAAERSGVAE
jgi:hypothetical protein